MNNLVVQRDSGYADKVRKYKIYCNSNVIGKVGDGESVSFELPDGKHEIYFKVDWARSNKITLNARHDEVSIVNVGSSIRGWKLSLAAFYVFFMPHKYLWAKVQSS